jgi:hypothetical protein
VTLLHPSARYSLLVRQRILVALGAAAALAAISLSPGSAQAYVVTVNGVQYDVTTFTGSYDANTSKFALPPGGVMPWWGDNVLSGTFATAVGANLGLPNSYVANTSGPVFAYTTDSGYVDGNNWCSASCTGNPEYYTANSNASVVYAQATLYTTPVPAPLPLLGSAAALGFCRRLRSRSKRLRHGASRLA